MDYDSGEMWQPELMRDAVSAGSTEYLLSLGPRGPVGNALTKGGKKLPSTVQPAK